MIEKISVIIPSYNEKEETILKCFQSLKHDAVSEIIIVEGGGKNSPDTFLKADPKARFIRCKKSRAIQMNIGAAAATGALLHFVHADTILGDACIDEALNALNKERVVAVSFSLHFDSKRKIYRFLEFGVRLRNRFMKLPYGDQCYFLKKDDFLAVSGFDAIAVLEDVKFIEKLKKIGKIKIVTAAVTTSSRRYEENGVLRTFLKHLMIMTLHFLGFSPKFIASDAGRR